MKFKIITLLLFTAVFTACSDLDLNPLSEGASGNWYSNVTEVEMSVNDLFQHNFWYTDAEAWSDDESVRANTNPINSATINGEWDTNYGRWANAYKCIARANTILLNMDRLQDAPQATKDMLEGNALFIRAAQYARMIAKWGDVIYYDGVLDLDEAFTLGRTDKNIILQKVYEDFDAAVAKLPLTYSNTENRKATKGTALGMKARAALYMGDWATARDAAKACMDLGIHELYPDFGELFLSKTIDSKEVLWAIPKSTELGMPNTAPRSYITRNAGGWAQVNPSWELLCSFLCTDGLPIDESPLFDPHDPFKNRDPRCNETIVPFQTEFLGFMYQPHPDSLQVFNFKAGKYQKNNDTRSNTQYASYTGLVWKKGIDEDWSDDQKSDNEIKLLRYAEVLLTYAEAKIELNEIDESVLDAINQVRARAYKVSPSATSEYPAVTTTDQAELRTIVRVERRMELAWEGLRYMDIIRWRIAEVVVNRDIYGMLDPAELREKVIEPGLWFFPETPEIDENGGAIFEPLYQKGLIKLLVQREFDVEKQYLWPIPTKEILINPNLDQNPGY